MAAMKPMLQKLTKESKEKELHIKLQEEKICQADQEVRKMGGLVCHKALKK